MCGILGIVAEKASPPSVSHRDVERMRDRMAARGPDDATLLAIDNIIFAHRRLAIRDRAGGKQPIVSPNGRYVITYNGEIYNDAELREELPPSIYKFSTHCDTEVLAAAWQAWGIHCVPMLRGMFAFAVYDRYEHQLTLVRDRFGIKPLFYTTIGNEIVFASTIAAIRQHPRFSSAPDMGAIRHYLTTLRLTLGERTVFEDIRTVEPAETITFRSGAAHRWVYWTPPQSNEAERIDFREAVDELQRTLREAVSMRLVSDVPVGMMISGGVDSSLLARIVRDETKQSFHARCGGGDVPALASEPDDFHFAQECAKVNDLQFSEVRIDSDHYLGNWQRLIAEYETPVSTPTDVIINRIASDLVQSVGVALGGEGADEACCGYQIPHWSGSDFDLFHSIPTMASGEADAARASLQKQYGDQTPSTAGSLYLACNSLIPSGVHPLLLLPSLVSEHDEVVEFYNREFGLLDEMSNLERTARVLLRRNLESLLSRLDSATMLESLESRVPYTDHRLVEQLFRLPLSFRIDVNPREATPWRSSLDLAERGSLRPKRLIHALSDQLMPRRLARRPKASFPTPLPIWLNNEWHSWLIYKLKTSPFAQELFRPSGLEQVARLPDQLSMWKWPVANLILWGERCFA